MIPPLLVLDVHYLCHRAFHTMRDLSWKGRATGVIFGFLQTLLQLMEEFQTERVAFCFEHPHLFRRVVYPEYKRRRRNKERTEQEKQALSNLAVQICELRKRHLPKIGFKNIFCFRGFESDDIMAAIACSRIDEVVLVTADSDLFQCLWSNVTIYSPQKQVLLTKRWFIKKYGIYPHQWAAVKALSGCSTDEVQGIKGVGELTALRYLRGELKTTSRAFLNIESSEGSQRRIRNLRLVELPYKGCPKPDIEEDEISLKGWREVTVSLGMKSLGGRTPFALRRKK